MVRHMLLQMPLLVVAGVWLLQVGVKRNKRFNLTARIIDPYGASALVLGTGWMLFWMIPLHLDLATIDPLFRVLKVVSVPLGIGLCFGWVFSKANLLVKMVIGFELWASVTRLGWIFVESPEQLCSSYLIGEQQQVGTVLLLISAVVAVTALLYGVLGNFSSPHSISPQYESAE